MNTTSNVLKVQQDICGSVSIESNLLSCRIDVGSQTLISKLVRKQGVPSALCGRLIGYIQKEQYRHGIEVYDLYKFIGITEKATLVQSSAQHVVVKVEGIHIVEKTGDHTIPYVVYLYFDADSDEIKITHSFHYDTTAYNEILRGIAIEFTVTASGSLYNRHVGFVCETGMFYEGVQPMHVGYGSWGNENPQEANGSSDERVLMYERQQLDGQFVTIDKQKFADFVEVIEDNASFSHFRLTQNSRSNYMITKCTHDGCAYITAVQGTRSQGAMFVGSEAGIVAAIIKDCYKKAPMTLDVKNLATEEATLTLWFVSRYAQPSLHISSNEIHLKLFEKMPGKLPIMEFAARVNNSGGL